MKTIFFLALLACLGTSLSLRGREKDNALILDPGQGDIGVENVPPAQNTPPATGDPNAVAGGDVAVTPQVADGAPPVTPDGAVGGGDGQGGGSLEGAGGVPAAGVAAGAPEEIPSPESKPEETTIPLPPEEVVQDAPEVTKADLQKLEARVQQLEETQANQQAIAATPVAEPSPEQPATPPISEVPQNGEGVADQVAEQAEAKVEKDLNLPLPTTPGSEPQAPPTFQATPNEVAEPLYGIASGGVNTSGKYKNFPTDKAKNTDPVAIAGARAAAEEAEDAHKDFVENDLDHIQDIVNTVQDAFIQEPPKRFQ